MERYSSITLSWNGPVPQALRQRCPLLLTAGFGIRKKVKPFSSLAHLR